MKPQLAVRLRPASLRVPFHTDSEPSPPSPTLDRLLLDAARTDNVDQLTEVFSKPEKFNINFQDG